MLDTLSRALVWADGHGLTVPVILGAITVLARLVWAALRPTVLRRWPSAVPVVEGAAARVAALLPDVLAAILRRRPAAPSGRSGEAGRATVATLVLLALVGALGLAACPRAREAALDTQSPRVGCVALSHRCHDGAPEVCSAAGRWWPSMPRSPSGEPRRCADVCEVVDGVAGCRSSVVVTGASPDLVPHEWVEGAAFGIASLLIHLGVIRGVTAEDWRAFMAQETNQ